MTLPLTLPIGWTAAEIRALLAPLRDDAVLVRGAADDRGVTLGWSLERPADRPTAAPTGPPALTWPATLPGLPQIARALRHLPAAPGRPTIEKAGEPLGIELKRTEWIDIRNVFAEFWPPDPAWWAHLPAPVPASGPATPPEALPELPATPAADGR